MPFKSKKQRKWMHANKPKMAKKWEKESVKEGDLGPTTKKGKTVKAVHKKSGKEIVVVDTPASRKKLKRMGFKVESVNEAKGNVVVIDRKYIPKIAHVRKVLKLKMGKDLSVYKTDSNNVYHKVSDSQIKRFLDRLDRFDVKYKLGESVNEGLNKKGFTEINKSIKAIATNFKDLQNVARYADNENRIWNEVDNIRHDLNRIEKILKNKTYNESVNEAVNPKDVESYVKKKGLKGVDLPFWKVGIDYPFYPTKFHYVRGATAKEAEKKLSTLYHRESGGKIGKAKFDDDRFLKVHKNLKESVNEAKTASIDGEELMNFLMKRFKMSKKKAIDTMKKHKMDTSFLNEAIKVRVGETPMEGKWGVYDNLTGKAIKEVGNARAATRLMNRLMSSGQYKEVTAKWIGELVNEASSWGQVKTNLISIIRRKQHQKIDGFLVDMQTANVILKVGNALNQSNQKKYGKLPIKKMAAIAWKLVK